MSWLPAREIWGGVWNSTGENYQRSRYENLGRNLSSSRNRGGCIFLSASFRADAATITWTNAASGVWNTAANWDPNTVPGAADTAIITNAGVTVSLNGATTVGAIILGTNGAGTVTLSLASQTLALNGPLTVNPSGSFTVDGGTLVGNTNAVLSGTIGWTAGLLEGILTLSSGSTLTLTTGNNHDIPNCAFTNNGTVVWSTGEIRGGGNPGTVIYNNGVWDAQNDSTWDAAYAAYGTVFNNAGTFRKSGSAGGNTTFSTYTIFNNTGKLDCQTSSIVLSGGGNFTGGTATNLAGVVIFNGGAFNINGTVTSTNVQFAGGATLTGNNVISGGLNWISGAWNYSTETIATNSTVLITTVNNHDLAGCTVTNNGTVVWSTGLIRAGGNPGTVIYNNGVWDAQNDSTWNEDYAAYGTVFNNAGTFRKSGSTGGNTTFQGGTTFNQLAGKLDSRTNSIVLSGGGNFTGGIATNLAGFVVLNGGAFNINGMVTSTNVQLAGATLTGNNVISGGFNWISGAWNNSTETIATNTTVLITTSLNVHDLASCTVTNNGTVVWSAGLIRGGGNPGTVIYNNGVWDAQSDSTWNEDYGNSGTVFNNAGTLRKSGSTGGNTTIATSVFNNTGTIDAQTNSIIFQTDANFSPGSVFNGAGSTILSTGNFNINGATINSTLQLNGGNIGGTNTLSGTFIWNNGLFINATLMITISGVLNIVSANVHDLPGCTLINNGTVVWSAGEIRGGGNPGTVIYNNGVWDAQNDSTLDDAYGVNGTVFINAGTFRKSAGTKPNSTTIQNGVAFVNNGTVDAQNGLMVFSGSFTNSACTLAVENGATIQISQPVVLPGGLVTGSGTVQAPSITSSAVVSPGATNAVLNLAGNYTQLLGGSMQFDIGGTSPGVNQSQVNVTGSASLSGLIGLRFSPGYVPAVNSSNLVLTAGSRTGQFPFHDHFYLLGQNKRIVPVYGPTNLVLTTIAATDPANFSLSTAVRGQTFALAWPSEFGVAYNLATKTNLEDSAWTFVPGVTNFYLETPMTSPHKFFRLFPAP